MARSMRYGTALILLLVGAALYATGGLREVKPAGPDDLEPITLMLDWLPNVNHVGLFVARDNGFFEAEGLDVTIIEPGEVYTPSAVVGGRADFGINFQA